MEYLNKDIVKVIPMTYGEFDKQIPESAESHSYEDPGYMLTYSDGHIRWVDQRTFFNTCYNDVKVLRDEHSTITNYFNMYNKFVQSGDYESKLNNKYLKFLFEYQMYVMNRYISILEQRMAIARGVTGITTLPRMSFGDAIEALRFGFAIRRAGWNGKGLFVIKQVPAHITEDIIPKMQSLPESAKDLILKGKGFIDYTNQCLIYNENTGTADSWTPSISDVFACDWEIVS